MCTLAITSIVSLLQHSNNWAKVTQTLPFQKVEFWKIVYSSSLTFQS